MTKPTTIPIPVLTPEEVNTRIEEHVSRYVATAYTPDKLKILVDRLVREKMEAVVMMHLGIKKDAFGHIQLTDKGEKGLDTHIQTKVKAKMNEAFESCELTEKHMQFFRKTFNDALLSYDVSKIISKEAERRVQKLVDTMNGRLGGQ